MSDRACPLCSQPMERGTRRRRLRRGDREVSFGVPVWICRLHPGDVGGRYVVLDTDQAREADATGRHVWRTTYGEELPEAATPGRPTADEPLDRRVPLRLSAGEIQMLDALRGDRTRSAFLREVVRRALLLKERLERFPGVRSVFLDGEEGRWELQVTRDRVTRPRSVSVEGTTLAEVEERVLGHLVGAPEGARVRFHEEGLAWFRDGVWRPRHGPLSEHLLTRVRLEMAAVHPSTDNPHMHQVA